ncbi:MAG TPA: hypothetical protein VGZ47_07170 [Gemmataceae bacterium]|nr:hypothetical protein [Gemmataceae bacterium]
MSFADTRAAMLASSNASISSTPADSGQQSSTHVTSSLSADNSGNTSDAPGQNSKTNGQAATSSTANPNTALEAAIRGLTLPSSLSALMNRSAFTAASAPQTTDAIGAASPHSDRSQPSFEANSAAEPRSGDLFPTQAEDGNVNESDSRAMEALALMAQWRMALEEATLIAKATNDDDEEALAVVRDEAPAGLATKGAGFLEQFTPLDPGTMDQAVQRFLAQFQSKNEVRGGASSLQNLAVLTAAIGTALVGIEFIRRKRQRFHIPSFLSGSTYQSGIKSTRADRAWKKLSSYFAHRSSARRPA